jgi:hypothetical protein
VSKGGGHPGRARGFNPVKSPIASVKTSRPRGRDPEEIVMPRSQSSELSTDHVVAEGLIHTAAGGLPSAVADGSRVALFRLLACAVSVSLDNLTVHSCGVIYHGPPRYMGPPECAGR